MDPKELRELSISELRDKHKEYKEELFNLRFQNAIGQLSNSGRIREVKKTIARILTIITEKEAGMERAEARR
ncbi:50S ribosomal protein L29 [Synergistes jonesii]|uniref:Large ribosomal subunit protein uL29 n=1 Tax=Synergistes jonesii TaxID=2754 RepID=A0A073ITM0_9BACT|nr:50S ribosomal protein L29 [Synergistes jonesii]KEJ93104.1 50S ribosomal protein L29 [Synergistes jonesii]OFB60771.1 50S ribosomal protein L29 [Synergistes jonesii]OFB64732.1 50S ribosomal protein L29 [Synergistes jonesii]OFB66033.1 50S ribosomal protein L29 [Synergistes jonesii]OFB68892.1 50S ribosomal protein L29 [Synergistes jonesii]